MEARALAYRSRHDCGDGRRYESRHSCHPIRNTHEGASVDWGDVHVVDEETRKDETAGRDRQCQQGHG